MRSRPLALVISFTDLSRDARVDRQVGFLREHYEVITAGTGPSAHEDVEFIDLAFPPMAGVGESVRRARNLTRLLLQRYRSVYWTHPLNRYALAKLQDRKPDVVVANDVSALPLACEVAEGGAVVLDAHEYAPAEQAEKLAWRLVIAPYAASLLRSYLPRVDAMMTVSLGIAELYASDFGVTPTVVTNAPPGADLSPTPVGDPIRIIHHGVADPSRRLEQMVEAVELTQGHLSLDLMLVPADERYFVRLQEVVAGSRRSRIVEPCRPREIAQNINNYDIGMYLLPPQSLNHELALPNKIFDFIQARLAIAIGPSREMSRLVRAWKCGLIADDFTPSSLAVTLGSLTPDRIMAFKNNAHRAAVELTAERNRDVVLDVLDRAMARRRQSAISNR